MASQSLDPGSGSSKSSSTRRGYTGLWDLPNLGQERDSIGDKDRHRNCKSISIGPWRLGHEFQLRMHCDRSFSRPGLFPEDMKQSKIRLKKKKKGVWWAGGGVRMNTVLPSITNQAPCISHPVNSHSSSLSFNLCLSLTYTITLTLNDSIISKPYK